MDTSRVSITIGPGITDLDGNPMNQNGNAILGESNDAFFTTVNLRLTLQDAGGFLYDLNLQDGSLSGGGYLDPGTGTRTRDGSFAGFPDLFVSGSGGGGTYFNNSASVTLQNGGRTAVLGTSSLGGLDVHREVYVPSDDQFVRYVDVFTNNGARRSTRPSMNTDIWVFSRPRWSAIPAATAPSIPPTPTSSPMTPTPPAAAWRRAIITDGTLQPSFIYQSGTYHYQAYTVTIQPGQTIRLMTLETQQLDDSAAIAQSQNLIAVPASHLCRPHRRGTGERHQLHLALTRGRGGSAARSFAPGSSDDVLNTTQFVVAATDETPPPAPPAPSDALLKVLDYALNQWNLPSDPGAGLRSAGRLRLRFRTNPDRGHSVHRAALPKSHNRKGHQITHHHRWSKKATLRHDLLAFRAAWRENHRRGG